MRPGRVLCSAQVAPCRSATCRHRAHGLTPPARTPPTAQVIRTTREVLRVPLPPVGPATARFDFLSRMERADSRSSAERTVPPDSRRGDDSRHRVRAYRGAAEIPTETLATYTARYRATIVKITSWQYRHLKRLVSIRVPRDYLRDSPVSIDQYDITTNAVGRQRGTGPFGRAGAETRRDQHEQGGGALQPRLDPGPGRQASSPRRTLRPPARDSSSGGPRRPMNPTD